MGPPPVDEAWKDKSIPTLPTTLCDFRPWFQNARDRGRVESSRLGQNTLGFATRGGRAMAVEYYEGCMRFGSIVGGTIESVAANASLAVSAPGWGHIQNVQNSKGDVR